MDRTSAVLITLGCLFLLGLATQIVGRRAAVPRVTLLLLLGVAIGPSGLDLLPDLGRDWFPVITIMALSMVGFLLGGAFTRDMLREQGREIVVLSIAVMLGTATVVFGGLWIFGVPLVVALLLGAIGTATAPAASADVVGESGARGPFASKLLGIVAVDDLWGLVLFSLILAGLPLVTGVGDPLESLGRGAWEIVGAVGIGAALGFPMAYLTGRLKPGEPTQIEALGLVLLCGGVSLLLDVSYLLAAMTMGFVVTNRARHHTRPFHEIEGIDWPFMMLFFLLAGASLEVASLVEVGLLGGGYVGLRIAGRLLGAWLGGKLADSQPSVRRWMGLALLPQAGVAIGMTLIAIERHPELRDTLLPIVIGSTVLFEILGPLLTRFTLKKAGEVPGQNS